MRSIVIVYFDFGACGGLKQGIFYVFALPLLELMMA